MADAYPLTWPAGWERTPAHGRERARYGSRSVSSGSSWSSSKKLTIGQATDRLFDEIRLYTRPCRSWRINPDLVVLSTNLVLRLDGLPRSGQADPSDPGVAVYFSLDDRPVVLACDKWDRVADNIAAIAKALEAMRGLERCGVTDMMERAFTGFAALPDLSKDQPWRHVLGIDEDERSIDAVKQIYLRLRSKNHTDTGGDADQFHRIQVAWKQANAELT